MQDEFNPTPGVTEHIAPDIRRILAPNPSPMTYRGTNTYIIGHRDIAVIDPGPENDDHLLSILAALTPGQKIRHILVTHSHLDHSPLAAKLSRITDAPISAFGASDTGRSDIMQELAKSGLIAGGEGVDAGFMPDIALTDGTQINVGDAPLTAHWTPGHFGNHMCFEWSDRVFCGDLVMGWASSLVSPPDGDLTDFMTSCRKLRAMNATQLLPGHGAPVDDARGRLDWLIGHREARENTILTRLSLGVATADNLAHAIYTDTPAALMPAAARNVLAHLIDLTAKNRAIPIGPLHKEALFQLTNT